MSEDKDMNLARMFGAKGGGDDAKDDDEPSDDDVKKAKSDAFDAFFDAVHSKDREGARRAWEAMHDEDDEEEGPPESEPMMGGEEMGEK